MLGPRMLLPDSSTRRLSNHAFFAKAVKREFAHAFCCPG